MFIKNYWDINKDSVVLCTDEEKEYLECNGFIPISYDGESWYFVRYDNLLQILCDLRKGEE